MDLDISQGKVTGLEDKGARAQAHISKIERENAHLRQIVTSVTKRGRQDQADQRKRHDEADQRRGGGEQR